MVKSLLVMVVGFAAVFFLSRPAQALPNHPCYLNCKPVTYVGCPSCFKCEKCFHGAGNPGYSTCTLSVLDGCSSCPQIFCCWTVCQLSGSCTC